MYRLTLTPAGAAKPSSAIAELKRILDDGSTETVAVTEAYIGREGVGKQREGDFRTPCGELHILCAFGIQPDPGTTLEYLDVTPDTIACDTPGPYYNRIVDRKTCGQNVQGEEMFRMTPAYDYGLVTDYNKDCIYPLGSAIFIHCKGQRPYTAGCIAFDRDFMKRLVVLAGDGLTIEVKA